MSSMDLESGMVSEEGSVCFSDAEEGSCCSQFYSTADGSYDDYCFACADDPETGEVSESRRVSSVAGSDYSIDIANGVGENKVNLVEVERDCRICHLTLDTSNTESGIAIELGCSCKDDLAAAHKHCAETWFKIKGNKTCEICNSIARNIVVVNEIEPEQQANETNVTPTNAAAPPTNAAATENRSCLNGHRFLNFLLACMVFAFIISWLFHFNIPS